MTINLKGPELRELKPRIMVCGIGGAGGNAVNNMIVSGLVGVDFVVANTDAQALTSSKAERVIQMGLQVTEGLGAGSQPEVGRAAAEEAIEEIRDHLAGAHMCFVTAGMGGGTGTGAAPVIARAARDMGILTVGVVTKPFQFEGQRRARVAEHGISELQKSVDTLICIPNQNLFRVANERTTFADAFSMADQVLYSGVACITDLMVKEGLINLDFADVRAIMREMGKAMMGTGEASGDKRAIMAAEAAIANPLLDEVSMKGARGLLISITGGNDLTLYEVDEAASRIRQEVDDEANIILGATFDSNLDGIVRVSVVATGIDQPAVSHELTASDARIAEAAARLRAQSAPRMPEIATRPAIAMDHAPFESVTHPVAGGSGPAMASDVEIVPIEAKAREFQPAPMPVEEPHFEPIERTPYIPPAPQAPRNHRMPAIDDFPIPGQKELREKLQAEPPRPPAPVERRRSLLERLTAFGMSRTSAEEPGQAPTAPVPAPVAQLSAPPAPPPMATRPAAPAPVHTEYAKRPVAPQAGRPAMHAPVDQHGRGSPVLRHNDDEQLEIPAFLRRQSS